MSRARNIKPAFFANEELVELPFETRLLFIGLWTLADREGRLEDRPRRIKMAIFPADSVDVDTGLDALHEYGFIRRYAANGVRVIQVVNFSKHQKPHPREAPSHLPGPDTPDETMPRTGQGTTKATPRHDQGMTKDMASPASSLNPSCLNAESGSASGEGGGTGEGITASPAAPPPARIGSRLPSDWILPPTWRDWARQQRPDLDLTAVADRFRDHWLAKPGKDGRKADWEATWRNWIRRENGNGTHRETAADRHRHARNILSDAIADCPEIVGTGVLRTDEDDVSRILDGEVVNVGRTGSAFG